MSGSAGDAETAPREEPAAAPEPAVAELAVPGARLLELVRVMDTLRRGCPWDARQTHESLMPYLLEETYEAVDALAAGDQAAVREELGDVLLQVMFHARVAQERTDGTGYDIDDVADGIISKLTRRHPHVFGDVTVSGADEVTQNWDAIKAAERAAKAAERAAAEAGADAGGAPGAPGAPVSALAGVPLSQPALSLAAQLLRRAEKAGAPAELVEQPADQASGQPEASEIGRELLALVGRARAADLDPELELRAAALAYAERVRAWESGAS
ncbi:MAG TPA: MazG family protein [Streptosporangiaceae bacterium]|nr:MazG family protein [Streptosporangiaceae bacterium]